MSSDVETKLSAADTEPAPEACTGELGYPLELGAEFTVRELLGRGGMGEVVLARDRELDRDVAIKRLRPGAPSGDAVSRFLREARIQARLDHPAVVPVHELGRDAEGQPYFAMKRLTGVTLSEVIARDNEPLARMLRAFIDVSLAVGFAHSRGVIHRDLKPANVMLGDFGEVYVLDWGLAKLATDRAERMISDSGVDSLAGQTQAGALLGTPGYMSPEQIRDASRVGEATDAYALGAILFELLAGEPLHDRDNAIASTLADIERSPSRRRPERSIAPELDALCLSATATDPAARPSARELADRVQSFLDGDRDLALRRQMAAADVERARARLADGHHDEAMHAAGRALALDPTSPAAEIVSRLMLEPSANVSPGLQAELDREDARRTEDRARLAVRAYAALLAISPLVIWNGVNSWRLVAAILALTCVLLAAAVTLSRDQTRRRSELWLYAIGNAALIALVARVLGPFIVAPALACVVMASLVGYPAFGNRGWLIGAGCVLGWSIPVTMELAGVLRPSWTFVNGVLEIRSYAVSLDGPRASVVLIALTVAAMIIAALIAGSASKAYLKAQHELLRQRWQLGQLLPHTITR